MRCIGAYNFPKTFQYGFFVEKLTLLHPGQPLKRPYETTS